MVSVLRKRPEKIGKTSFELKALLELDSIEAAVQKAAERFGNEMLFKKPNDYKKDLMLVLSADESVFRDAWPTFVEAKARRDIGVHNGWYANEIYRSKVREVGGTPTTEATLAVNHEYLQAVRTKCLDLMKSLKVHCEAMFA